MLKLKYNSSLMRRVVVCNEKVIIKDFKAATMQVKLSHAKYLFHILPCIIANQFLPLEGVPVAGSGEDVVVDPSLLSFPARLLRLLILAEVDDLPFSVRVPSVTVVALEVFTAGRRSELESLRWSSRLVRVLFVLVSVVELLELEVPGGEVLSDSDPRLVLLVLSVGDAGEVEFVVVELLDIESGLLVSRLYRLLFISLFPVIEVVLLLQEYSSLSLSSLLESFLPPL
jgi:hypothetical protein